MRIPSGKVLLVYGVLLGGGAALAAGQGELSVERQEDGTLVIGNTGNDQGAVTPGKDFTGAGIGAGPGVSVGTSREVPKPAAIIAPNPRPGTGRSVPSAVGPQSTGSQEHYRDRKLQEAGSGTHAKNPASARRYLMMDRSTYQSRTQ